jgi:hypothetical protein
MNRKEEILKQKLSGYWKKQVDKKEHPLIVNILNAMEEYAQEYKSPQKISKLSDERIKENEDWFKIINFNNPIEVAHGFGTWLNLYFDVWSALHDTWIDSNRHAYTTEELLTEFINEFNPEKKLNQIPEAIPQINN